jgi:ABC-type transport system involved in cytochrome bd biosynthesis fused ATPase/permease subunit
MVKYCVERLDYEVNFVRYILTLFWTALLMFMLTYVVSSMVGVAFSLQTALILGVIATILIYIIPFVLPQPAKQDEAH